MRRRTTACLLVTLALAAAMASGCAPRSSQPVPPPSDTPSAEESAATRAPEPLSQRMMPFAQRRAQMPQGMPVEVPVIAGSVISTSAPVTDSSWLYTLETSGTVESVADWYGRAYANAGWKLAESAPGAQETVLRLRKGGAETVLRVSAVEQGIRVDASIGVGARAPEAF